MPRIRLLTSTERCPKLEILCESIIPFLCFRTPGTGLYDNLQQYNIPDPTSIFDITYFSHHPKAFFTLARELYPGKYKPSLTHLLVKLLQDKKILLRSYTQNIDGLERSKSQLAPLVADMQGGKLARVP